MSTTPPLAKQLADINRRLTIARSVVFIAAHALDHGDTDLELHAAEALKPAADALDDVISELLDLMPDVPPRRLGKRARNLLGIPEEAGQ